MQFSIALTKQIVVFFDKTEQKSQNSINETETILKQRLKRKDREELTKTITSNETTTKQLLQQRNFKKFTSWKYKPKCVVKTVNANNEGSRATEEQPRSRKPSYARA